MKLYVQIYRGNNIEEVNFFWLTHSIHKEKHTYNVLLFKIHMFE